MSFASSHPKPTLAPLQTAPKIVLALPKLSPPSGGAMYIIFENHVHS